MTDNKPLVVKGRVISEVNKKHELDEWSVNLVNKIFTDVSIRTITREQQRIAVKLIYKYGCPYGHSQIDDKCINCWLTWFNTKQEVGNSGNDARKCNSDDTNTPTR